MRHPHLKEILQAISDVCGDKNDAVMIYGSQSRGSASLSSDIDLLVLDMSIFQQVYEKAKELSETYTVEINPQKCTLDCLYNSHMSFWRTVRQDCRYITFFT